MTPVNWTPHHREDDGELLGFLVPAGELFVPVTVFGSPLGEPAEQDDAAALLDSIGLGHLAGRWTLIRDGGAPLQVEVVEAGPRRVVVQSVDPASELDHGTRFELATPVGDRLVRSR